MRITLITIALATLIHGRLAGQEQIINVSEFATELQEEIKFRTDRKYYIADEIIWFDIYCYRKNTPEKPGISRVVYLEIGHPTYGPVIQEKIKLENGYYTGGIRIPDKISNGHYYLRAYTNISVSSNNGSFLDIITFINPDQEVLISDFGPSKFNPDSSEKTFNPEIIGNTFQYFLLTDRLKILFSDSFKIKPAHIAICDLQDNILMKKPVFSEEVFFSSAELEEGILKAILYDAQDKIIQQSLVFWKPEKTEPNEERLIVRTNKEDEKDISIELNHTKIKEYYGGNINISLLGANYSSEYLPAFALTSQLTLNNYLNTIPSVSTDVKTTIKNYLKDQSLNQEFTDGIVKQAKIKDSDSRFNIPEIHGATITGKVIDLATKNPLGDAWVILTFLNDSTRIQYYKTTKEGRFIFSLEHHYDTKNLALIANHDSVKRIEILVDKDFVSDFEYLPEIPFKLNHKELTLLKELHLIHQVQEAYNISLSKSIKEPILTRQFGNMDYKFELKNYIKLPTLTEIINEIVVNVRVTGSDGEKKISIWDDFRKTFYHNPLILLDNLPVSDIDALLKIKPEEIEKIGVVSQTYYLGDKTIRGILSIDTKEGKYGGYEPVSNIAFLEYKTFLRQNNLLAERHNNTSHRPFFLSTLFWSNTPLNDTMMLRFPKPDNSGNFQILFRGINNDGKAFVQSNIITIK